MKKLLSYLVAVALFVFGLLTLFLSSSILFDWFGIRAKEGNYVLFVVIANFIVSVIYLFAAYGFFRSKVFTSRLLYTSVAVLIASFIALFVHINLGGAYETKTIGALFFRIILTSLFTVAARFMIDNKRNFNSKKISKLS